METNQDLYKQAILDAKAVRETAMAAARTTLAEHFEPKIREMMNQKLSEDMEDEAIEESMEDESKMEEGMEDESMQTETPDMEESTLDEILAELDGLLEDTQEESIEEGKESVYTEKAGKKSGNKNGSYSETAKASHGDHKLHEADEEEAGDEETPEGDDAAEEIPAEGGEDAQEVVDITVGDLKDIIRDVFMQLQGGGAPEGDLDADTQMAADMEMGDEEGQEKEISLEEILAELEMEESKMEEAAMVPGKHNAEDTKNVQSVEEVKKELNEAIKTIKTLKAELNEVNLFNAKMLYVNKIFKAKNLNEAQKTKVINAFDRVTSVKEVENTYKTLVESLGEIKKSSLKESVGFASKPIGNAPARPIVEADAFVSRWQTLAGIK